MLHIKKVLLVFRFMFSIDDVNSMLRRVTVSSVHVLNEIYDPLLKAMNILCRAFMSIPAHRRSEEQ